MGVSWVVANSTLLKKIMAFSPYIEVLVRKIYWSNISYLSKRIKINTPIDNVSTPINYQEISGFLNNHGVKKGSLLLVHSSFSPLKGRGKTANQVVDFLLDIIGDEGTLAMPAMPKYRNAKNVLNYLDSHNVDTIYHYDVQKSGIKTGVLPLMLHKRKSSIRSRHPINTMVAKGPLASALMKDNLVGKSPLACGKNSSWNNCLKNDAYIVGLGTDVTHSLTAIHIAEDVLDDSWPISDWYIEKTFRITDHDFDETRTLRERDPKWGALHFAERRLCKDLIDAGILKTIYIDGILVEIVNSTKLVNFLNNRNNKGYPYFWV